VDKDTYDKINEYTSKSKGVLTQAERDYVLRKFLDSYYEALEKYKVSNNGIEADAPQKKIIISSLLNDSTLQSYVDSAKSYFETVKNTLENDFKKTQNKYKAPLWKSLITSVVANFIYSLLLLLVFWVAKDQISSWLRSLAGN